MYNCPHCEKPGISVMRKMALGPAIPATCKSCGAKVGVPYSSMLTAIPFMIGMLASFAVEPIAGKIALWGGGAILMLIIYARWVPLVKR